jgi:hypothetical protein
MPNNSEANDYFPSDDFVTIEDSKGRKELSLTFQQYQSIHNEITGRSETLYGCY